MGARARLRDLEQEISQDKYLIRAGARRLRGAVHERATSPGAFAVAFGGGFLFGLLRRTKVTQPPEAPAQSARRHGRMLSELVRLARLAAPLAYAYLARQASSDM